MPKSYRYRVTGLKFYHQGHERAFVVCLRDQLSNEDFVASPKNILSSRQIVAGLQQEDLHYLNSILCYAENNQLS